jgi:arylsulfatase A-like enzyme
MKLISWKQNKTKYIFPAIVLSILVSWGHPAEQPNFLIITIDDLNDYVGCLGGHSNALTPNLDRLAHQGMLFTHAYCNSPVCNPSRTSLWTGLRPTTTGITSNRFGWFRDLPRFRQIVTLPQALARAGYVTAGFGKLFHVGRASHSHGEWQRCNTYNYGPLQTPKLNFPTGDKLTDWGVPPENTERAAGYDPVIADRVIAALEDSYNGPFLLGCGFYRPHTPLYAARNWFDLHPQDTIALPKVLANDNDDLVCFGKQARRPQDIEAPGLFNQDWAESHDTWHALIQAYLACTSAMDHQLGRVLDALARSRHCRNTYVIAFSDHGWHLGEKRHWGKAALWEQTTRVPFIVAGPGIPPGRRCTQPVELLSVYPTIMDYAGLTPPHALEGHSLRRLLKDPDASWPHPVLTTFVDHHSLRTQRWRYIRYAQGGEELYDHDVDPHEFTNLAVTQNEAPQIITTLNQLRQQMEYLLR